MAEVSLSGPIVDQDYDSDTFQAVSADESGIVNDWDGSAFKLTRPSSGTLAEIGSTTLQSVAIVGGYSIRIAEGATQSIDIPVSTNPTVGRWDLIVARYNSAWLSGLPRGPVRIHRIAGVEGSDSLPSWDNRPYDGIEDVPLHAIRRVQGTTLLDSEWRDMRVWSGRPIHVGANGLLPTASLGCWATKGGVTYSREMVSGSPAWVEKWRAPVRLTGTAATADVTDFWERQDGCEMNRVGNWRSAILIGKRKDPSFTSDSHGAFASGDVKVMKLHPEDVPPRTITASAQVRANSTGNTYQAGCKIDTDGWVWLTSTNPNVPIGPDGTFSDTFRCQTTFYIP